VRKRAQVALDTSCLIALLSSWHEFHLRTLTPLEARRKRGERFILSAHTLMETFSVLTRLPPPVRIAPMEASERMRENFGGDLVAGLEPKSAWLSITQLAQRGLGGGRVYDAAIASSVLRAGAAVIFTWNVKDFLAVAPPGLEIREPD
jgi:predicted nucleic acid-binding protein